ncbi:MAG: LLM class flavin-dependent oxidoreductase [Armatimonadetes bacterium]|nr:LLM class flavin-dependent oxidoreductase [Armatimonadota bacterium]
MKFGLFLASQHGPGESMAARFAEHVEQVEVAREVGFVSLFTGHHYLSTPYQMLQPVPVLSYVASRVPGMSIGPGVLLLALVNPVYVAEEMATLDVLTGGRLIFGVGLGYREEEYDAFGVPRAGRVRRFTTHLDIVRRLWAGEAVTYETDYCTLRNATLVSRPLQQPHPPIWIAANNDGAVRRAARLGDTWFIAPHSRLAVLEAQMALYREERARLGLPMPEDIPLFRECFVGEDRRTVHSEARPYLERKYQTYVTWGQDRAMPAHDPLAVPYEELVGDRFIVGTPEECVAQIRRYRQVLGITHLVLRVHWAGLPHERVLRSLRLIGREVMPALARA